MSTSLQELAAQVRRVYEPPERRAWSLADVAIVKLLRAIETMPSTDDAGFTARLRSELEAEKAKAREHFDVADAMAAFERARRPRG